MWQCWVQGYSLSLKQTCVYPILGREGRECGSYPQALDDPVSPLQTSVGQCRCCVHAVQNWALDTGSTSLRSGQWPMPRSGGLGCFEHRPLS